MSKREDSVLVQDILDCILKINNYVTQIRYEDFENDFMRQDAVLRNFTIIGEASRNFSKEFRKKYHHLPFKEMIGLRDRLVHDYSGTKYELVWDIILVELPPVKNELEKILKKLK